MSVDLAAIDRGDLIIAKGHLMIVMEWADAGDDETTWFPPPVDYQARRYKVLRREAPWDYVSGSEVTARVGSIWNHIAPEPLDGQ